MADAKLGLDVRLVAGAAGADRRIAHTRVQKSGLVLVGHRHGLVPERVQILGETELSYLLGLSVEGQERSAEHLFSLAPGLVLVTRGVAVPAPFLLAAERSGTPLAVCAEDTSLAITALHGLLDERLAPRMRIHGVLVDVFEVGVLLLGRSGIGKSECALDLVQRGHRLVADDVVECDFRPPGKVFGEAAPLLRYHIEVRGLGILDLKELFGVTGVRDRKRIDLVVQMEDEDSESTIDRLGLDVRTRDLLGVSLREVTLLVRPGRSTSAIVEMAARNELLRVGGKDASRDLVQRIDRFIGGRSAGESGMMPAVTPAAARGPSADAKGEPTSGARDEFESSFPKPPYHGGQL